MSDNEEETKPQIADKITLTVRLSDGGAYKFKVKPLGTFDRIFRAVEEKKGVGHDTLRFIYNGTRVRAQNTPAELGMEEEDEMIAELAQIGG